MSKILIDEVTAKQVLEYVESVPDDRYAVEHIDRDTLVTDLREALASEAKKPDFWEGYAPEPVKPRGEATLAQQWNAGMPPLYPKPEPGVSIKAEYEPAQPYKSLADYPRYWIDPVTGDVSIGTPSTPAQQEPVAWTPIDQPYPPGGELDILMGDGSILCEVLPQSDGDLWWGGASTGERFIDPKYASVTHWRIHAEHTFPPALSLAQRSEASTWVNATTWRGLTDEELSEVYNQADWDTVNGWEYERAIEAKLRSKNEDRN